MPDKNERRAQREHAVDSLNTVARVLEIEPIPVRASAEEVTELYESLCEKGSAEHRERIAQARDKWMQNGGHELDAELLTSMGAEEPPHARNSSESIPTTGPGFHDDFQFHSVPGHQSFL